MSTRVAVVGGGANSEHEVSRASADSVATALDPQRFEVVRIDVARTGGWLDATGRPLQPAEAVAVLAGCDVLFPLVHGPGGEDGTLAALATAIGLPCVGSGLLAGAVGMDKWLTKLVAAEHGVRVARGDLVAAGDTWPGPCVVKPVAAGSSNGVRLVDDAAGWEPALAAARAEDPRVLAEEVLVGREIDVAVLRRADGSLLVSPALEVRVEGFFDYEAKYSGGAQFQVPAPLEAAASAELERLARTVFTALGCAGVARVDFFLTADGWVLNEVNTVPGMTATSQVPLMFEAAGLGYPDLLAELVEAARPRRRAAA